MKVRLPIYQTISQSNFAHKRYKNLSLQRLSQNFSTNPRRVIKLCIEN